MFRKATRENICVRCNTTHQSLFVKEQNKGCAVSLIFPCQALSPSAPGLWSHCTTV